MQRIGLIAGFAVDRFDVHPAQHLQARLRDPTEQLFAGAQAQVLCQVRQNQPAFAARAQVFGQAAQEALEHLAAFVVDGLLQQGRCACGQPRRVAHHQGGLARREQIGVQQLDLVLQTQALEVVPGAGHSAFRHVGCDHLCCTTSRQDCRQNTCANTDVKSDRVCFQRLWQRRLGHQAHIFPPYRGEHAVVRIDAQGLTHGGNLHPVFAPLKRTNHALQAAQRDHRSLVIGWAKGLHAGGFDIGCTAQVNAVVTVQLNQNLAQNTGALGLRLAVGVKCCTGNHGYIRCWFFGADFFGFVDAPCQRLQHLSCVLKIAAPQQASAGAS